MSRLALTPSSAEDTYARGQETAVRYSGADAHSRDRAGNSGASVVPPRRYFTPFQLFLAELEALGVSPDACRALHSRRYQPMAEEILEWTSREGCQILLRC